MGEELTGEARDVPSHEQCHTSMAAPSIVSHVVELTNSMSNLNSVPSQYAAFPSGPLHDSSSRMSARIAVVGHAYGPAKHHVRT